MQLEHLLRLTATMLCRQQYAEISLDVSKITILMLKIKNWRTEKVEDEELEALFQEDSCVTLTELAESLRVDHTTFLKRWKVLGVIQN